ncbi:MM3350-like domain-containing protein [Daldinia grandis]|nr:MM3350-like domain-containing protein [Daldinia grandis]
MSPTGTSLVCDNPKCDKASNSTPLRQCKRCKKGSFCSLDCWAAFWPAHRNRCVPQNYIVKFELSPKEITGPPIFRTLSCPADAVFHHLHMALQIAFGWATTHCFEFEASPMPSPEAIARIREMWMNPRSEQQPIPSSPEQPLLRVVDPNKEDEGSFGFDWQPSWAAQRPKPVEKKADNFMLFHFFDDPKYTSYKMVYNYDFGDCWEHEMTLLGRGDATHDFVCIDGVGHCAAEGVGGSMGWQDLKEAYRAARPDEAQRYKRRWFETMCSNADAVGLEGERVYVWDHLRINEQLKTERLFQYFNRLSCEGV